MTMSDAGRPRARSLRSSGLWSTGFGGMNASSVLSLMSFFEGDKSEGKRKMRDVLEGTSVQMGLFLLLSYVLFVNNIATIARASDASIVPINVTLIVSFVLFCLEMCINFWTASKQDYLYMAMELIGTFSILLEVSWIATALGLDQSIETENVSKTAIITSRAGMAIHSRPIPGEICREGDKDGAFDSVCPGVEDFHHDSTLLCTQDRRRREGTIHRAVIDRQQLERPNLTLGAINSCPYEQVLSTGSVSGHDDDDGGLPAQSSGFRRDEQSHHVDVITRLWGHDTNTAPVRRR